MRIPPRVILFCWLALHCALLTMENLRRCKKIIVNACPMCLASEETVDHLLLNCKVTQGLWYEVLSWFDCCWTQPSSILRLFEAWRLEVGSNIWRVIWRTAFLDVAWFIWKERNSRCFEDFISSTEFLAYRLKITIASWVSILPQFQGIPFDVFLRN